MDFNQKGKHQPIQLSQDRSLRWSHKVLRPVAAVFILTLLWTLQHYRDNLTGSWGDKTPIDKGFKWESITPSKQLIYHPCHVEYQCARLEVPMDWNRTDGQGATVAIAIIRLPAKVPVMDVRYGGPVILNPGGPGGSGVSLVLKEGKNVQNTVDFQKSPDDPEVQSSAKYFDVVSFDPRGVNNTTPPFSCFANPETRRMWKLQSDTEGNLDSSDASFNNLWARAIAFGETCSLHGASASESEWIGRFMNTPPVVADMVELVERHAEWREKETSRLLRNGVPVSNQKQRAIQLRNKWQRGEEKLLYWGFSYGSVLGATFAAMQPGRIHRLVVDGVCDSRDYYAGNWLTNLQDADSTLQKFFEYCYEAGPESCPLALDSLHATTAGYYDILADVASNPIAVPESMTRGPDIITYSDVHAMVVQSLYKPMTLFPTMARLLADLSHRNGSSFADFKTKDLKATREPGYNPEALSGVLCADGKNIHGIAKGEYREYWKTLRNQSQAVGDEWATIRLPCAGWHVRPEWAFDGSFVQNTSHPLLFIGNSYDPVTPIRNAVTMSSGFSDSVVLQQDSLGHCSLAAPSKCTAKFVRLYFQTGKLPPRGTICEVDERPFGLPGVQDLQSHQLESIHDFSMKGNGLFLPQI
ncbi:TAP-like protein-domain-containing protein [Penicillium tannophilum]|nr:TAP-like protein-domain-containing protein [Penicillium tannophilum]